MQNDAPKDEQKSSILPALALAAFSVAAGGFALHLPPQTGEMGLVFPPWTDQGEAIAAIIAAGGRVVDAGRLPNVMIAYGSDPGFAARVRAEGAWLVAAANGLCAPRGEPGVN